MKTNVKWGLLTIALFIVLFTAVQLLRQPAMTEAEMNARIEEIYGGVIRNIVRDGDEATIAFTREKSMYEVTMDIRTGTFSDLEIIFEDPSENASADPARGQNSETGTSGQPSEPSRNAQPTSGEIFILTPDEANAIATSKYFGIVQTNQFIEDEIASYYEIEIASTTQRYTIHVAAHTGEIILVRIDS